MRHCMALAAAGLLLLACGGSSHGAAVKARSAPPTTAQVQAALQKANEPITAWTTYTAASDVNHLLGRPHQYTAKLSWRDSRVTTPPVQPDALAVDDGGGAEIFASSSDRDVRLDELKRLAKNPLFAEYDYAVGAFTILRVSHALAPDQALAYQAALSKLA